ncbi:MAG: aconitase/3-isopropylmalate dehydratase large subunit family protein [bacterium]
MGRTIIEKIIAAHADGHARPGDLLDLRIDVRVARDFGGANVVKNLEEHGLGVADPHRTFFTFDCNPTGSDQKYAANQQTCRVFARNHGIRVFDINAGIGTHLAIDKGLVGPGDTFVSTDSHANILGAIGAFGQGMGDADIAHAFAHGRVWFEVPPSVKVVLKGRPGPHATAKDVALALLRRFGADGLLGVAAELYGEYVDNLSLDGRITIASLATEMGAIILLIPPAQAVLDHCSERMGRPAGAVPADPDAEYLKTVELDIAGLEPLISRPGHPEDVAPVAAVRGRKVDSVFIGSCTDGRLEDLEIAARVLRERKVAPGVVLKVVPATDELWRAVLDSGLVNVFKRAGALFGNAGCAGCAAGQVGQNGPGEVTVSTGNRNFAGKQGRGEVWLASPLTAAASAVAGVITTADAIPEEPVLFAPGPIRPTRPMGPTSPTPPARPLVLEGRVWVIAEDNVDTDMIYHNRHLAVTDFNEMGQHAFGNLKGRERFAAEARPGDIVVAGRNFGAGSSRQQAVDCFLSLGIHLVVARSFGAIYFRNAVNAGLGAMVAGLTEAGLKDGDRVRVELETGVITLPDGRAVQGRALAPAQLEIYRRGGLLARA